MSAVFEKTKASSGAACKAKCMKKGQALENMQSSRKLRMAENLKTGPELSMCLAHKQLHERHVHQNHRHRTSSIEDRACKPDLQHEALRTAQQ